MAGDDRQTLEYPVPSPIDWPTPDRGLVWRRGWATVGAFGAALGHRVAARKQTRPAARAVREAFVGLGGTYLKFGQIVASAPGMFGDEVAELFRSCLDTGPVVPPQVVRRTVEAELGRPLADMFARFDPEPIGRASLAVVHRAVTTDGEAVAVKVLRPGIEDLIAADLAVMAPLFRVLADNGGMELAGAVDAVLQGLREQLAEELDLRNERRTMDHHRELFARADLPMIVVPRSRPDLSDRRVLTMELLDGVPLDALDRIAEMAVDPGPLADQLVKSWFMGLVRDGTFHGDMHAGNLLLLRDGRLGVIDWGIVGRLDEPTHRFFRRSIEGMLGDETAWDDLAASLVDIYGESLAVSMGEPDEMAAVMRDVFASFFTQPFSAFTMAQLMQQMPAANGLGARDGAKRSFREVLGQWRLNRRARRLAAEQQAGESPFNRGMMLLVKQLLYFDRYGHMFLQDTALLEDRAFYERLLRAAPLVEGHRQQ
jgi:predicted unusual protein kinase regulating ubiquinone biosynthesis (AarF/ABC1/UbiB family)